MGRMRQRVRDGVNVLLERFLHYRLTHRDLSLDSNVDALQCLAKAGLVFRQAMDVGAARGAWTRAMLPRLPECRFTMIEPLAENCAALDAVQAMSGGRAVYRNEAVGRQSGTLTLNVHHDQTSCFASEWGGAPRNVPVHRLDDLLADGLVAPFELLKMDVQGAEMDVLAGAERALATCQAAQIEVSFRRVYDGAPLAHEVMVCMAGHGFRIFDVCNTYKRPKDRALLQADMVFARDGQWFQPETWRA